MTDDSGSAQSQLSTGSFQSMKAKRFVSNAQHVTFADQVFKRDIDITFSKRFLGTWDQQAYQVHRKPYKRSKDDISNKNKALNYMLQRWFRLNQKQY